MNHNYRFTDINTAFPILLQDLLAHGEVVESRAGATKEFTHVGITLTEPLKRELLLADRKASIAAQVAETMWVLSGRDDMEFLSLYLPRATDFSDDGKVWRAGYGKRLRDFKSGGDTDWGSPGNDQIQYVVNTLRAAPASRQAVAVIWDPYTDATPGKDIPCNDLLNFSSRNGKLDLHVFIRSNDAMWGWSGINAFEWSALLEIVAGMLALDVGSLHFSITSFHLYDQHWEKAAKIADKPRFPKLQDSPRFNALGVDDMQAFDYLCDEWFRAEDQIRSGRPYDVESFPEPMLQSWLRVIQWWWSGDSSYLEPLRGTALHEACQLSIQPKRDEAPSFTQFVDELHTAKHLAYGDSWKRRGEYMIMANIARKVDRLEGGTDTPDETQTDTAVDLLVYLCKYDAWLQGLPGDPGDVRNRLMSLEAWHRAAPHETNLDELPKWIVEQFGCFETSSQKSHDIGYLMEMAYCLAWSRWTK